MRSIVFIAEDETQLQPLKPHPLLAERIVFSKHNPPFRDDIIAVFLP